MSDLEFYVERCGGAVHTVGQFIDAVFKIDSPEDAARFYRGCVAHIQAQIDAGTWESRCTAERGAMSNIGWVFGEGMKLERVAMWRQATGATHPIFG